MTSDLAATPAPISDFRSPVSAPPRRWRLRGRFPEGELASAPYPPLIRHLLWHRGVRTPNEAAAFMDGAPVDYDPLLLPDIEPALSRLRTAISEGELIAVYGDFDVDGVTASVILIEGLRELGGRVFSYLPDRFSEGYGLNTGAIDALHAQAVTLIVTADCGTSSVGEIDHAGKLGIDTIVLDHHTIPPELPAAVGRAVHHECVAAFGFGDEAHAFRADPFYFAVHVPFLFDDRPNRPCKRIQVGSILNILNFHNSAIVGYRSAQKYLAPHKTCRHNTPHGERSMQFRVLQSLSPPPPPLVDLAQPFRGCAFFFCIQGPRNGFDTSLLLQ